MIRNESLNDWPDKVARLYDKHFDKKTKDYKSGKEEDENMPSVLGGDEEFSIKEELIR